MPYDYNASLREIFLLKENQNPDSSCFSTLNKQWYAIEKQEKAVHEMLYLYLI